MKDLKSLQKTGARLGVGANKGRYLVIFELKRVLDYGINLILQVGKLESYQRKKMAFL